MGTRGAYGFRIDGKDLVTYNHWDSYPDGLGADIVQYICERDVPTMIEIAERIELIDQASSPTGEQQERWSRYYDPMVDGQTSADWYALMRDGQGQLNVYDEPLLVEMIDNHDFLADSLFCEYAYIINLDTEELEFYRGFNTDADARGRYASLSTERSNGYMGVVLVTTFPLADVYELGQNNIVEAMNEAIADPDEEEEYF